MMCMLSQSSSGSTSRDRGESGHHDQRVLHRSKPLDSCPGPDGQSFSLTSTLSPFTRGNVGLFIDLKRRPTSQGLEDHLVDIHSCLISWRSCDLISIFCSSPSTASTPTPLLSSRSIPTSVLYTVGLHLHLSSVIIGRSLLSGSFWSLSLGNSSRYLSQNAERTFEK